MKNKIQKILNELNDLKQITLINMMQIQFIFLSNKLDTLIAKMPINSNLLQPFGYLHGGATMILAESVGSSISLINVKKNKKENDFNVFSIEISANHVRSIRKGILFAKAKICHKGNTLHFVQVNIYDEKKNIISFCKLTNIIIIKKQICP
ncbi:hotdog fold thioesterase [Blattabacterium sp. DPU]|uniref:PaaI family thioesterase n=1 Tax=Blattabacterium sp. DPU TaxID=2715232 RepID=UPI00140C9E99|nr:hotdog fold thioesterase [Blattabacterium sp. DPU]QIK16578.1 hotdog fold thioesterase [Blattabacterium sp. DPU]